MVNKMVNTIRKELTPRQEGILKAVEAFVLEHGYAPTVRQVGLLLRIASPSAVFKHLGSLEKKGYLTREGGELRLAGHPAAAMGRVPLAGLVPAGTPKEAFDFSGESAVDVPDWMIGRRRGNIFCIRVEGKSMIDAFIDDGDTVLLERTNSASSGEMIVGLLEDGSVTLKRLRREEDGKTFLVPENPLFKPFEVENLRVLGRVIGVMRKY